MEAAGLDGAGGKEGAGLWREKTFPCGKATACSDFGWSEMRTEEKDIEVDQEGPSQ